MVVLPLLPAGDVALHRHDAPVHLRYSLIGSHRHNIDGQHHVPGIVHQLGDHGVLDEAGILPQEQGAARTLVHGVAVGEELQRLRRDGVAEVVAAPLGGLQVEGEGGFLPHAEEVMEQAQEQLVQVLRGFILCQQSVAPFHQRTDKKPQILPPE